MNAAAGVAPHAGWTFSGRLACRVFAALSPPPDTVLVVGGHLMRHDPFRAWPEQAYETPLGDMPADLELLEWLREKQHVVDDPSTDSAVEVQLPLARHFLPESAVLGMCAPPSAQAYELGRSLARWSREAGRRLAVVGSTDLTHYGPSYGFTPHGRGAEAVRWVKEVNDAGIVDALVRMDPTEALNRATRERSACSVGGALVAMGFGAEQGVKKGRLLEYTTSYDVYPGDSVVGYAAVIYPEPA